MPPASCHSLYLDTKGPYELPSGKRPTAAWGTQPSSQEMSDTTRQAGFGLSKQNTAGPTVGHSDFPRFHGTEVPGQRQTGLAWRQRCIPDITVAPGQGACEDGRGCPCWGPQTSLWALALHCLLQACESFARDWRAHVAPLALGLLLAPAWGLIHSFTWLP